MSILPSLAGTATYLNKSGNSYQPMIYTLASHYVGLYSVYTYYFIQAAIMAVIIMLINITPAITAPVTALWSTLGGSEMGSKVKKR